MCSHARARNERVGFSPFSSFKPSLEDIFSQKTASAAAFFFVFFLYEYSVCCWVQFELVNDERGGEGDRCVSSRVGKYDE